MILFFSVEKKEKRKSFFDGYFSQDLVHQSRRQDVHFLELQDFPQSLSF